MKTLKEYAKCIGCESEIYECFKAQSEGLLAGFDFDEDEKHLTFFVINPITNKFIVPIYLDSD